MAPLCYRRHRFPAEIIQHAIWLYVRFTLSYRDVEELLAERGLDISYETVRRSTSTQLGPLKRLSQRKAPKFLLYSVSTQLGAHHFYFAAVDRRLTGLGLVGDDLALAKFRRFERFGSGIPELLEQIANLDGHCEAPLRLL
jgi:hypothetical protein